MKKKLGALDEPYAPSLVQERSVHNPRYEDE